jgi:hypothetical protein
MIDVKSSDGNNGVEAAAMSWEIPFRLLLLLTSHYRLGQCIVSIGSREHPLPRIDGLSARKW